MGPNGSIYALNLFDIVDRGKYLAYTKRWDARWRPSEANRGEIIP